MEDLTTALEALAQTALPITPNVDPFSPTTIQRWQRLFDLTHAQARLTISDELWAIIREEQEELGHDRESYAFALARQCGEGGSVKQVNWKKHQRESRHTYLFKLVPPLDTIEAIQRVTHLPTPPPLHVDEEDTTTQFVQLDTAAKRAVEMNLHPAVTPTFIALRIPAAKELSDTCIVPTLGIDATVPQYRLDTTTGPPTPQQNSYPVPYFFYGTLAEPERLMAMLGLGEEPILKPAVVRRGRVRMWAGKYRALVDGGEEDVVHGWMYIVENKEHEDALRMYEGVEYEVVRCEIGVIGAGGGVRGLTFRFCGNEMMC